MQAEKLLPNCKFIPRVLTRVRGATRVTIPYGALFEEVPSVFPAKTLYSPSKTFEGVMIARGRSLYRAKTAPLLHRGDRCRPSYPKPSSAAPRLFRRALQGRPPVARLAQKHPSGSISDLDSPPFRPVGATIGRPLFKQKDNERQNQNLFSGTRATDSRPYKNRRRSIVSPPVPNRRRNHKHRAAAPFTRAGARCTHL